MSTVACPELCPDCPLAQYVPTDKRQLEQSDGFIAKGTVSPKGNSVSFDFEGGRPVGSHLVEIGLVPDGGGDGVGFWVDSSVGLSGVAHEIENCKGPRNKRHGFLKLGKRAVCGAALEFAEEA
jgi:hypothetical protein